jgi:ketosteroid isomerase-like protein
MNEITDGIAALDTHIDELASEADLSAMAVLLADDFVYVHSNGNRQNKSEWLESLMPLAGRRRRVASQVAVELHRDIAIATGDLDVVWNDGHTVRNRYVRVYRYDGESWRAIAQRTVPALDRS